VKFNSIEAKMTVDTPTKSPTTLNPKVPMPLDTLSQNELATSERIYSRFFAQVCSNIYYKFLHNAEWGLYPKEYNKKIHGPYYPFRNYGKVDTRFGDVKIGDLGAWLSRRSYSPRAMIAAFYRYKTGIFNRWVNVRRPHWGLILQLSTIYFISAWYCRRKQVLKYEVQYRYH